MRMLMDNMEDRLKKKFLEDIDEEVPEEYIKLKEQEEIEGTARQTTTTLTHMGQTGMTSIGNQEAQSLD